MLYFDSAATTIPFPQIADEYRKINSDFFGNPSSPHELGRKSAEVISSSREICASAIGARSDEIYFTSCGTESNNLVIKGLHKKQKKNGQILSFSSEHPSVIESVKLLKQNNSSDLLLIDPPENSPIDYQYIKKFITPQTYFVSCMQVNNVTGVINNINEIGNQLKKEYPDIVFHVDGIQGFMKIPVNVKTFSIDAYTVSSHKIHGGRGASFIYLKNGLTVSPIFSGGGQENKLRSGTENTAAIACLAKAVSILQNDITLNSSRVIKMREQFLKELSNQKIQHSLFTDKLDFISPYILNLAFQGIKSEILIRLLSDMDTFISASSACSTREQKKRKYVLKAFKCTDNYADQAVRVSFSILNTEKEISELALAIKKAIGFFQ